MSATSPTHRIAVLIVVAVAAAAAASPAAASYGWPVKPFHAQHPIRSYFGDPRRGSTNFVHFGIDISAPDGTPVYATVSGTIRVHPLHPTDVVMVTSGSTTFEYWHIRPAVTSGYAVAYRTVLGRIISPCAHVHFSERHGSTFVNPLRPDGLQPYLDTTAPAVGSLFLQRTSAGIDVSVEAHDVPPLPVPAPWDDLPVTPALVEWRLRRAGASAPSWHVAADFRGALPNCYDAIFAPATRQNTASTTGTYRFALARGWRPAGGRYVLQVRVADTAGHTAVRTSTVVVASAVARVEASR